MHTEQLSVNSLFDSLDDVMAQFSARLSSLDEKGINEIPFEGSWTAAQLASHITKSTKGIAQAMEMKGQPANRDPAEGKDKLKKIFLDFNAKYQSPEFILPTERIYEKENVISEFNEWVERLKEQRSSVDLTEMIDVPLFGETTKLELLYFVLYHSQRHLHQLENILKELSLKNTQ